MNRAVYMGGVGSSEAGAERVAGVISDERNYDVVDAFSLHRGMQNPDDVRKAVRGVPVVTNSAGALALKRAQCSPKSIEAIAGPVPTSRIKLFGWTLLKTVRMHTPGIGIRSLEDMPNILAYDLESSRELVKYYRDGVADEYLDRIAAFNTVDAMIAAQRNDILATMVYADGDEYFRLIPQQEEQARRNYVDIVRIHGIHDELTIRTRDTLAQIDSAPPSDF